MPKVTHAVSIIKILIKSSYSVIINQYGGEAQYSIFPVKSADGKTWIKSEESSIARTFDFIGQKLLTYLTHSVIVIPQLTRPSIPFCTNPFGHFVNKKTTTAYKETTHESKLNQVSPQFRKTPLYIRYEFSIQLITSISRHNCHSEHTILVRKWVPHNDVVVPISYGDLTILLRLKIHVNVIKNNKGVVTVRNKIALESNFL